MKTLLILGVLLTLTGATLASSTGVSGSWMVQTGLIFLFGALAVSRKEKIWTQSGLLFMVALFLWGFVNGMWYMHPLGAIISIVGGGWVVYRIMRSKEYETENLHASLIQGFSQKLLPNVKQHIKWVSVPFGILLALWLSKSILIAFVIGFGITAFLDRQSIQTKGVNRVAIILLLYTVGFLILLVGTFKITDPHDGIFYNMNEVFFDRDSYIFLRDTMRGL
ncbi:MAG: hypothetical protein EXS69_02070 [Candidatus Zambryskibacteria bacterium]|nr:hypothetical protein [Candidatus Zambryskibacteria bacterium]